MGLSVISSFEKDGIEYRFFDHLYAVSRCGKVLRKLAEFQPGSHPLGYLTLGRGRLMHRVVALCWVPTEDTSKHVHHVDGNKQNNRADNLVWVTPKEHMGDMHAHSGHHIRSAATRAKLSAARLGKKDSPETARKKGAIFAKHRKYITCEHNGIIYPSIKAGAAAIGLEYSTFRVRCLSKNFPDYKLFKP